MDIPKEELKAPSLRDVMFGIMLDGVVDPIKSTLGSTFNVLTGQAVAAEQEPSPFDAFDSLTETQTDLSVAIQQRAAEIANKQLTEIFADISELDKVPDEPRVMPANIITASIKEGPATSRNIPSLTTGEIFWNAYSNILAEEKLSPDVPITEKTSTYIASDKRFIPLMEQAASSLKMTEWQTMQFLTFAEKAQESAKEATFFDRDIDEFAFKDAGELMNVISGTDTAFAAEQLGEMVDKPLTSAFSMPEEPLFLKAYAAAKEQNPELVPYIEENSSFMENINSIGENLAFTQSMDLRSKYFDIHFSATDKIDFKNILLKGQAQKFFDDIHVGKFPELTDTRLAATGHVIEIAAIPASSSVVMADLPAAEKLQISALKNIIAQSPIAIAYAENADEILLDNLDTSTEPFAEVTENDKVIADTLSKNSIGYQDIRALQNSLNAEGFDVGSTDASMGPDTAAGIIDYLSENPEFIESISDRNIASLLEYGDRNKLKVLMESSPEFLQNLEQDLLNLDDASRGEIRSTQIRMQVLGLYDLKIDGINGPGTTKAAANFHELLNQKDASENHIASTAMPEIKVTDMQNFSISTPALTM